VPRNHGKNTTLVAALTPDGLREPWLIEGAMDTDTFEWYIREQLAPTLQPGQVVVLDNLSAHKAATISEVIEARGCELLFLPPYSPDFTPIEQAFSKLKAILRGLGAFLKNGMKYADEIGVGGVPCPNISPHVCRWTPVRSLRCASSPIATTPPPTGSCMPRWSPAAGTACAPAKSPTN
jgi:transposase